MGQLNYRFALFSVIAFTWTLSSAVTAEEAGRDEHARDSLAKLDEFVEDRRSSFAISGRAIDIFGLSQDPKTKPTQTLIPMKKKKKVQVRRTPLTQILDSMKVSMVIPKHEKFSVAGRTIRKGQVLPVSFGKESMRLRVESISSEGILFRNMQTGELAMKETRRLPKGVTIGDRSKAGKGIQSVRENEEAPLILSPDFPEGPPPGGLSGR
ncbi:MAG: hypothetical protein AAGC74_03585 [Verrucomicrobiota bacterium]